jgi:hypothetical protein
MSELTYAGATIIQSNPPGTVSVVQKSYITNLAIPEQHDWDFGAVRTSRGRLSWLATVTSITPYELSLYLTALCYTTV